MTGSQENVIRRDKSYAWTHARGGDADGSSYHGRIRAPLRSIPLNSISSASARSWIFAAPSGTFGHAKTPGLQFFCHEPQAGSIPV